MNLLKCADNHINQQDLENVRQITAGYVDSMIKMASENNIPAPSIGQVIDLLKDVLKQHENVKIKDEVHRISEASKTLLLLNGMSTLGLLVVESIGRQLCDLIENEDIQNETIN